MGARILARFKLFIVTFLLLFQVIHGETNSENKEVLDDSVGYDNNKDPGISLEGFEVCEKKECNQICGSKQHWKSFCDPKNSKLCMCSTDRFMSSNVEGTIIPVNRENPLERNCSLSCNVRNSYARIWHRSDYSKSCTCLMNQVTMKTRTTLCDEFALEDVCKDLCKSESAICAFSGVCLCRKSWSAVFHKKMEYVRDEVPADQKECSKRCRAYNTEYHTRVYDLKMNERGNKTYEFGEKYCLCGEELDVEENAVMMKLVDQGFQPCTGLKCKMRCGMNMQAECEAGSRSACLCPRNTIFIGKFLWARLPTRKETVCVETCLKSGLAPRVIEWNPFFDPRLDRSIGVYRTSQFPYLYDGKFCHCISLKNEPDINQFRPCTNELCQWLCGHHGATCDQRTRRVCICNTHQMAGGLGRKPDPGENNCNVMCRRNLNDARVFEVVWDIPAPSWSVTKAKFCGCVRPVTAAGLSHCDGMEGRDLCPKMCSSPTAFCTREKVCECNIQPNIRNDPMIRVPNGKEAVECGEVCKSWTWPLVEDIDHEPYIYDEGRKDCYMTNSCPPVDTSPWTLSQPGALQVSIDDLEENADKTRRYCLCVKSNAVYIKPGLRMPFTLEPPRLSKTLPCIFNYTCIAVGDSLHIVA